MPGRRPLGTVLGSRYASKLGQVRGDLRKLIAVDLGRLAMQRPGRAKPVMYWTAKYFFERVVKHHRVILVGWPKDITFQNLSFIPNGIEPLQRLLGLWRCGMLHFERISDEQLALLDEESAAPGKFIPTLPSWRGRSDIGKHRYRFVTNPLSQPERHPGTGAKSHWYVTDELERRVERELEESYFDPIEEAEDPVREPVDEIEEFSD